MPNVKWRTNKKSFEAFAKMLVCWECQTLFRYRIHMNDMQRELRAAEMYDGVPRFVVNSQNWQPEVILEDASYFITKADVNLSKNIHKSNLTLKSQPLFLEPNYDGR